MTSSRLRRLLALLCTLAMVLPVVPAFADVSSPTTPPDRGTDDSGTYTGDTQCVDDAGYLSGRFIYSAPYSRCDGIGIRTNYGVATTFFEVWRFYGTESNPAQGYTVSRLNIADWDGTRQANVVFAPHPDDAHDTPAPSLWREWDGAVVNGDAQHSGPVRLFNSSGSQRLSPGDATWSRVFDSGGRRAVSTDQPFRRSGTSCAALQTNNGLISDLFDRDHPDYDSDRSDGYRELIYDLYQAHARSYGTAVGLATINARGSAPSSPESISYDDGIDCSSNMDFVVSDPSAARTFTTCWIPVESRYIEKDRGNGGVYRDYTVSGGPRYHNATLTDRYGRDRFTAQRSAIYSEVASRSATVLTPAQPYGDFTSGWHPARDAAAAGRTARDYANCVGGQGTVIDESAETTSIPPSAGFVNVGIASGPSDYAHVGGRFDPARWVVTRSSLLCGRRACDPTDYRLTSLSFDVRIRGVGGYDQCSSSSDTSCDFTWRTVRTDRTGRVLNAREVEGLFYVATERSERVRIEIRNARGTYQRRQQVTLSMSCDGFMTILSTIGGGSSTGGDCDDVTTDRWIDTPLPVRAGGSRTIEVTSTVGRG